MCMQPTLCVQFPVYKNSMGNGTCLKASGVESFDPKFEKLQRTARLLSSVSKLQGKQNRNSGQKSITLLTKCRKGHLKENRTNKLSTDYIFNNFKTLFLHYSNDITAVFSRVLIF